MFSKVLECTLCQLPCQGSGNSFRLVVCEPQAGRPLSLRSPRSPWPSGLRVDTRGCLHPRRLLSPAPRPDPPTPFLAWGPAQLERVSCGLCGPSPRCTPLSLSATSGLPSGFGGSTWSMLLPFPECPLRLTTVGGALLLPGATTAPCLLFWDLMASSGHLRCGHTGCFAVRSEGGPGLISLQRPARLLIVISPKPLAFLALNSGATLSFAKL